MTDKDLIGKTIKEIEVDGGGIYIEFTDGAVLSYSSSDGGYSTWGVYKSVKEYTEDE